MLMEHTAGIEPAPCRLRIGRASSCAMCADRAHCAPLPSFRLSVKELIMGNTATALTQREAITLAVYTTAAYSCNPPQSRTS